jgi:hypothetical protein
LAVSSSCANVFFANDGDVIDGWNALWRQEGDVIAGNADLVEADFTLRNFGECEVRARLKSNVGGFSTKGWEGAEPY